MRPAIVRSLSPFRQPPRPRHKRAISRVSYTSSYLPVRCYRATSVHVGHPVSITDRERIAFQATLLCPDFRPFVFHAFFVCSAFRHRPSSAGTPDSPPFLFGVAAHGPLLGWLVNQLTATGRPKLYCPAKAVTLKLARPSAGVIGAEIWPFCRNSSSV